VPGDGMEIEDVMINIEEPCSQALA